jgi:hypothetical protein
MSSAGSGIVPNSFLLQTAGAETNPPRTESSTQGGYAAAIVTKVRTCLAGIVDDGSIADAEGGRGS